LSATPLRLLAPLMPGANEARNEPPRKKSCRNREIQKEPNGRRPIPEIEDPYEHFEMHPAKLRQQASDYEYKQQFELPDR
jgi:hypothetical protein